MIQDVHEFFDNYKDRIHGFHVYCTPYKISISVSPRTFTEESYLEHVLKKFMHEIKPKLKKEMVLEITVNNRPSLKKLIVNHKEQEFIDKDPDFDYMNEVIE